MTATARARTRATTTLTAATTAGVAASLLLAACAPSARASADASADGPITAVTTALPLPATPSASPAPAAGAPSPVADPQDQPREVHKVRMSVNTPTGKVGIGYLLTVSFSDPVKRRGAAEKRMLVTVDGQVADGAWSWRTATTAMFRPVKGFWPAKSRIALHSTLAGTVLAREGASKRQHYVANKQATRTEAFRTARSFIAYVNGKTDRFVVKKNGKKIKTMLTSLGKPGYATRSGIKVAMDKYLTRRMTSQEAGITNESYDVTATYAVRVTPTGEFVHGAPWAHDGRFGNFNASHGCTNLTSYDAKWYYDRVKYGDPVITTGTGRPMEWTNGMGGPWNIPWKQWLKRSALKGQQAS